MSAHAPARPRLAAARRALVGAAWALAWMLVWGSALLMFSHRAQAAPLTLAVAPAAQCGLDDWPVSDDTDPAAARGLVQ